MRKRAHMRRHLRGSGIAISGEYARDVRGQQIMNTALGGTSRRVIAPIGHLKCAQASAAKRRMGLRLRFVWRRQQRHILRRPCRLPLDRERMRFQYVKSSVVHGQAADLSAKQCRRITTSEMTNGSRKGGGRRHGYVDDDDAIGVWKRNYGVKLRGKSPAYFFSGHVFEAMRRLNDQRCRACCLLRCRQRGCMLSLGSTRWGAVTTRALH